MEKKKLYLILDLDQTILHATQADDDENKEENKIDDLLYFRCSNQDWKVKFRPGLLFAPHCITLQSYRIIFQIYHIISHHIASHYIALYSDTLNHIVSYRNHIATISLHCQFILIFIIFRLAEWLKKVNELFIIHVYTNATREYADNIIRLMKERYGQVR